VHLIIAYGAIATRAARHVTSTIPLVMIVHPDPVAAGLVASLAQPGGNITGVARISQELSAKRLELLTEAISGLSRLAVLWQPGSQDRERSLALTQAAAQARGVQLHPIEVHDHREFEDAFSAIARHHVGGLITVPGTLFWDHRALIVDLAVKHRLPAIFPEKEFVDAGGFMSYGTSLPKQFRRAAYYVGRLLKDAKPADLPVEQPTTFELVINLQTAQALGLTIPPTLLFQADEVIQPLAHEPAPAPPPSPAAPSPRSSPPAAPAPRFALVIGNAAYSESPSRNPINDATDLAALLQRLGFTVTLRRDADRRTMERAIEDFTSGVPPGSVGLFYFSGHGAQIDGLNYLIPTGERFREVSDVKYRAVAVDWVLARMDDAKLAVKLLILDACRDNPFGRSWTRSLSRGLAQMDTVEGSVIAYATGPGKTASDGGP
jgi:putative tryptophan/tyrosine transport system substrate-binding protein